MYLKGTGPDDNLLGETRVRRNLETERLEADI
jgi:hypothetical protein